MVKHAPEERMKTVRFCPAAQNKNRRILGDFCFPKSRVGLLGIEPSLPAPKAGVLPVYDSPFRRACARFAFLHNIRYLQYNQCDAQPKG
jgi:hypothetical protein